MVIPTPLGCAVRILSLSICKMSATCFAPFLQLPRSSVAACLVLGLPGVSLHPIAARRPFHLASMVIGEPRGNSDAAANYPVSRDVPVGLFGNDILCSRCQGKLLQLEKVAFGLFESDLIFTRRGANTTYAILVLASRRFINRCHGSPKQSAITHSAR